MSYSIERYRIEQTTHDEQKATYPIGSHAADRRKANKAKKKQLNDKGSANDESSGC
jgi:hypothetical protein